jgi:hypothetical protein
MTTGRINQVTTESRVAGRWGRRRRNQSSMKTTERGTSDRLARRSFYYVSVTNNRRQSRRSSSSYEYVDHNDRELPLSSVRLPNTPCEVGIFKTVELLTELHRPDMYDQSELDTVTLARRRLSSNEYVYPLFDRLSAGERQCRPLESKLARRN